MSIEELISAVAAKTGLAKDVIKLKIEKKQSELSGLVSDEGAAYIVANELGVKTRNRVIENNVKIADVKPNMKSVSVFGRVKSIIGPREFITKTGIKNKVANLEVVDKSGSIRVVLWNMSDILKIEKGEISVGKIIQAKNAYVKEGLQGRLEVHLGNRGILVAEPDDVKEEEFPEAGGFVSLGSIKPDTDISTFGRVRNVFDIRSFERDGKEGKVGNIVISDDSGEARVAFWNEQTELLKKIKPGDIVKIENARAKQGMRGVEIQVNKATRVAVNPEGIEVSEGSGKKIERARIAALQEGIETEIRGAIVDIFGENFVFEMCPACNKKLSSGICQKCGRVEPKKLLIVNATIDDGSGMTRAAFFREAAEKLLGMKTEEAYLNNGKVLLKSEELIGKEIVVAGRAKRNEMFDRLEFNVYDVKELEPVREAEKIINGE